MNTIITDKIEYVVFFINEQMYEGIAMQETEKAVKFKVNYYGSVWGHSKHSENRGFTWLPKSVIEKDPNQHPDNNYYGVKRSFENKIKISKY
jgi:hypothetical protein